MIELLIDGLINKEKNFFLKKKNFVDLNEYMNCRRERNF